MIENINSPDDLKRLPHNDLPDLAHEIRSLIVETVNRNGGHMASNLGVVELTIALHRVFDSPRDKVLFDTSHQIYTHKLLTGRHQEFATIRNSGGLSGFYEPQESDHDPLVIGHAATGPSMALGLALAQSGYVVCVVGDGALTSGLAYEGLSNITSQNPPNLMVILNDNGMSISENVGWLSQWRDRWLPQLRNQLALDRDFQTFEQVSENLAEKIPLGPLALALGKGIKQTLERAIVPIGGLWEEMGFNYLGPIDGHNIDQLIAVISQARNSDKVPFIHVLTNKGRGYPPAEDDPVTFHQPGSPNKGVPTFSQVFSDTLGDLMEEDSRIVAISAAMLTGTGLASLQDRFPERVFDVGICEEHAVSMAAAMSAGGLRPVVCIYSTFLQRAFDQIIHDVGINDLPVVFGVDRAGIVGQDGKTHHGLYDLAYMRMSPNIVVSAPRDENQLRCLLYTALNQRHPFSIRYPRGAGQGVSLDQHPRTIPVGTTEVLKRGDDICVAAIGPQVYDALQAAVMLQKEGISVEVADVRFITPLDQKWLREATSRFAQILVVEEASSVGGLRSAILEANDTPCLIQGISAGDVILEHGPADELRQQLNLTSEGITNVVRQMTRF